MNMWRQAGRERGGSGKNGKSKRCQRRKAGQEDYVNKKKEILKSTITLENKTLALQQYPEVLRFLFIYVFIFTYSIFICYFIVSQPMENR